MPSVCCPGRGGRKNREEKKKPSNTHTQVTNNIPHYFLTTNDSTSLITSNIPIFLTNNDSTPFDVQTFNEIITWAGRPQKELIFKKRGGWSGGSSGNGVCRQTKV